MAWRDDHEARPKNKNEKNSQVGGELRLPEEFPRYSQFRKMDKSPGQGNKGRKLTTKRIKTKIQPEIKNRWGKRAPKGKPMSP